MKAFFILALILSPSGITVAKAKVPEGFKLSQVNPDGIYGKLGLKNGDILLKLNELVIKDIKVLKEAFDGLSKKNKVLKLELFRDGKVKTITYEFK